MTSAENPNALGIKLKQYTPIIHFQHDQKGATLRASELKPKLDRFLKKRVDSLPVNKKGDLNYKVHITAFNTDSRTIRKRHPLYFGHIKDKSSENGGIKKFVISSITAARFFSFYPEVLKAIGTHLKSFLANTNFGSRQSKGFGSFYTEDIFDPSLIEGNCSKIYKFTTTKWEEDIGLLYSMLRSGIQLINRRQQTIFYGKSLMFLYSKKKGITWDKKTIKQYYFRKQLRQQQSIHNSDVLTFDSGNGNLMRDLLGLSGEQKWRIPYSASITKEHQASHKDVKIKRFGSPIIFKPIKTTQGYDIYFWARPINPYFLGEQFIIKKNGGGNMTLKTPDVFDMNDFLNFCSKVDFKTHIQKDYHDHNIYKRLNKIFSQLR